MLFYTMIFLPYDINQIIIPALFPYRLCFVYQSVINDLRARFILFRID
jgi:hypothetical protein